MIKKYHLFILLIILIIITRLLIFNKDASAYFPDEWRYKILITRLDEAVKKNDYTIPITTLFDLNARPGLGFFYYLPAVLEWKNPGIPFGSIFNLLISNLLIFLIFLIVKKIEGFRAAILATLFVTLSISSVIYMRHLLPYDLEFTLLLLAFYVYLRTNKAFIFGLLVGVSFITYPSFYYYILPIPILLILFHRSIKPALLFLIGFSIVLLSTQFFTVLIGYSNSYFNSLKVESGGVTAIHLGDYVPAPFFLTEYIYTTDGVWNLLLILSISLILFVKKREKKFKFIIFYLMMVFVVLETTSHILQMHVLYGRTMRPFYILLLIFAALVLDRLLEGFKNRKKVYLFCNGILILFTFLNWLPRFYDYKTLIYPTTFKKEARDFLDAKYKNYNIEDVFFANYFGVGLPPKPGYFKPSEPGKFYTVNAFFLYYYGVYDLDLFCKNDVLLEETHVATVYKPYYLEGIDKARREQMYKYPVKYQLIYCKI